MGQSRMANEIAALCFNNSTVAKTDHNQYDRIKMDIVGQSSGV